MPVTELRKVADPQALMEFYDEFVDEDYNKYAGMSDEEEGIHQAPTFLGVIMLTYNFVLVPDIMVTLLSEALTGLEVHSV